MKRKFHEISFQNAVELIDTNENEEILNLTTVSRVKKRSKSIAIVTALFQYFPMYVGTLTTPRLPNVNRSDQRKYAIDFIKTWSEEMFKRQFRLHRCQTDVL
jgi:hypothetical protein